MNETNPTAPPSQDSNSDSSSDSSSESHWTSITYSENPLMDALVKHALGLTLYGMSDVGEVLEIVSQMTANDEEDWLNSWSAMARRLQDRAETADRKGKRVSASTAYLRASTYWRVSLMCFNVPEDSRIKDYSLASAKCYERYLELSEYPGRYVEIPYEDSVLPGHFYRSPVAEDKAPLLILTPGNDTWAEDTRWVYDGALRRGIHCLSYDGPGQGYALRLKNLRFRTDWENVVGPVVDFAVQIRGIDPSRIGLMGFSFGGFLAPRAAAFEKRIKVCIADPGDLKWGDGVIRLLQTVRDVPFHDLPPEMRSFVRNFAWRHGVSNSVQEVIQALQAYDNTSIVERITCETLVMDGTSELSPGQAKKFFDALQCPKSYMLFDETTTAQQHCQIGGYATATEYLLDWLDERL